MGSGTSTAARSSANEADSRAQALRHRGRVLGARDTRSFMLRQTESIASIPEVTDPHPSFLNTATPSRPGDSSSSGSQAKSGLTGLWQGTGTTSLRDVHAALSQSPGELRTAAESRLRERARTSNELKAPVDLHLLQLDGPTETFLLCSDIADMTPFQQYTWNVGLGRLVGNRAEVTFYCSTVHRFVYNLCLDVEGEDSLRGRMLLSAPESSAKEMLDDGQVVLPDDRALNYFSANRFDGEWDACRAMNGLWQFPTGPMCIFSDDEGFFFGFDTQTSTLVGHHWPSDGAISFLQFWLNGRRMITFSGRLESVDAKAAKLRGTYIESRADQDFGLNTASVTYVRDADESDGSRHPFEAVQLSSDNASYQGLLPSRPFMSPGLPGASDGQAPDQQPCSDCDSSRQQSFLEPRPGFARPRTAYVAKAFQTP